MPFTQIGMKRHDISDDRTHQRQGMVRFFDAENGTEIKAVAVDEITGATIGTRPIRMVLPDES